MESGRFGSPPARRGRVQGATADPGDRTGRHLEPPLLPSRAPCDDGPVIDNERRPRRGSGPPRDPLVGIERLLLDGNNLLHALSDRPAAAPQAALIGRLRAVIPPDVRIEIVFDGAPDQGLHGTRLAHGLTVRHAGRLTADALLLRLVTDATGGVPDPRGFPSILVVTDDGRLAHDLRTRGAGTIGTSWVVRRLERPRLAAPSVGRPRPPGGASFEPRMGSRRGAGSQIAGDRGRGAGSSIGGDPGRSPGRGGDAARDADAARTGWTPGRGATAKRGNPKRGHPA